MRLSTSMSVALMASSALAGTLSTVSNWGNNPSNLPAMLVYTPTNIAANPAIVLALHPCGGSGQQYYQSTPLPSYADQYGFVVLYPTSSSQDGINCWDVHSSQSNMHDGGGASEGLAAQVAWALSKYNGNADKVVGVGASSGAMMVNLLAAAYPDVFEAMAAYSGVPAGCLEGAPSSTPFGPDQSCARGDKAASYSAAKWAQIAEAEYPGYSGRRTRMMIVHGTADNVVAPSNFGAALAQWSTVMGLSFSHNENNTPITNWKKVVYGDGTKLIGYEVQGGGHIPPFQADATLDFLGLTSNDNSGGGSPTTTTPPGQTTTPPPSQGGTQEHWGQCGGQGWSGPSGCKAPYSCSTMNPYYAQCL